MRRDASRYIYIYYMYIYIDIQVVPGRAGGGSFRRKKNYRARKEFAYRMCARRPTSQCRNHFFAVNEPSAVPWWWCDLFWCMSCHLMWWSCHLMQCDCLCCVMSRDVMRCDVRSCDLMRCDCLCCVMSRDAMRCHVMRPHVMSCHLLCPGMEC